MPIACSAIASRPAVTCSPDATTASYSRASCMAEASLHHATSSLVLPAMAETTTATSWPASTSRLTCSATLRMRSILATDVPPNFMTSRPMRVVQSLTTTSKDTARKPQRAGQKARIHSGVVAGRQPAFAMIRKDLTDPDETQSRLLHGALHRRYSAAGRESAVFDQCALDFLFSGDRCLDRRPGASGPVARHRQRGNDPVLPGVGGRG